MPFARIFSSPQPTRRLLGRPEAQDLLAARLPWILGSMLFWVVMIFLRLVWLQVVEHRYYRTRAAHQHTVTVPIEPIRGELRDRRGGSLAISLKVDSLFCTPPAFYPDYRAAKDDNGRFWGDPDKAAAARVAGQLAPILEMSRASVLEKLLRRKPFVWIQRQLPGPKVAAIRALKPEGVDFLPESMRQYPRGSLACQIVGFTNIDGVGQLGIERTYNEQLAGKEGELIAPRDAKGRLLILQENFAKIPVNGSTLQLTIDSTIQHLVEEALDEGMRQFRPYTAYAVVVDPNTGEILAMAGTPAFDPNHILPRKFMNRSESEWSAADREEYRHELDRQKAARKVHPVEDSYEPGSTMKIFTASIALEERKVHLGEPINCEGGRWHYKDATVSDTHHNGVMSFEEVLWKSSNIGAAKIGLRLDPALHYQYLRKFGFGELSGLNFPGESPGRLLAPDRWSATTQMTMCYGYGLSVTPLQILMAGCALANGGRLMQPYLVQKIFNDQGVLLQEFRPKVRNQVLSEETSALMRETLKGVITNGTARRAKLDGGVEAFGKTGTARKIINGRYDPRRHYSSFMGFFPADRPQYGVLFMLDDPAGNLTGGDVAAPLFKRIGDAVMRYRLSGRDNEGEADLKLGLRDWPTSENDEAVVHVEAGRVPDLKGLTLKAAIHRVVLAGGVPRVEGLDVPGPAVRRVKDQNPPPGTAMTGQGAITITLGGNMKFGEWLRGEDVHGDFGPPAGDAEVVHLTCDSRETGPGWAFAALKGELRDGAGFVPAALARGAAAILADRDLEVPPGVPFARMGDGRRTMARLARRLYREPDLDLALVGVTGTNGKTTTTTLVRQLLRASGQGCGLLGTVLNAAGDHEEEALRTTPESPVFYRWLRASRDAGDVAAAVEVSSHSLVLDRVAGARFRVGLFTNLTQDHLDFHKDMEDYFQAKALLFRQCGAGLANADDPYGRRLLAEVPGLRSYSLEGTADYRITGLALSPTGTAFRLAAPGGAWDVRSPLLGRFNAYNLLAALAALAEAGFPLEPLLAAVPRVTGAAGRLDRVDCGQPFGVLVDYAHTPDALDKLVAEGKRLLPPGGRLHVLFGCGGDRDRSKRPIMAAAAARVADVLWLTSDNPRTEDPDAVLDDLAGGVPADLRRDPLRCRRVTDRALAVAAALADCRPGDLLLLAGKGHEPYLEIRGVKHPYNDRAAVEAVLAGRPVPRPWAEGRGDGK